jgi:azurin
MNRSIPRAQFFLTFTAAAFALLFAFGACNRGPDVPPFEIEITGDDNMKFGITDFAVQPGQKVSVTLKVIGRLPKASMGHNLVVLKQNVNAVAFANAGAMHARNEYIAPETRKDVVAHTKLLGPGESDTITFTAPYVRGNYEYICSFPGHYGGGMRGVMRVQ